MTELSTATTTNTLKLNVLNEKSCPLFLIKHFGYCLLKCFMIHFHLPAALFTRSFKWRLGKVHSIAQEFLQDIAGQVVGCPDGAHLEGFCLDTWSDPRSTHLGGEGADGVGNGESPVWGLGAVEEAEDWSILVQISKNRGCGRTGRWTLICGGCQFSQGSGELLNKIGIKYKFCKVKAVKLQDLFKVLWVNPWGVVALNSLLPFWELVISCSWTEALINSSPN